MRLLILLALLALAPPAAAQIRDVAQVLRIEVLPGWRRADGVQVAALRFRLAPGWKTYWRRAGAAGIAPQMDWRGSRGLRSVTPVWPVPTVFGAPGALSIGFDRDFVLPLLIPAAGPGAIALRGRLDLGVCAEICLPAQVSVAAELPPGGRPDPAIEAALADRPARLRARASCRLAPGRDGLRLSAEIAVPPQGGREAVVFELPDPDMWVTDAAVTRRGGTLAATSELIGGAAGAGIDRSRIRITVIGTDGAVEIAGCAG